MKDKTAIRQLIDFINNSDYITIESIKIEAERLESTIKNHDQLPKRKQLIAFANYCEREFNCTEIPIDVIDEYLESANENKS